MSDSFELSVVSSEAFREIFQSMTEGIIVVGRAGEIIVANPVAEEMFGYGKNELMGRRLEDLLPLRFRTHHVQLRTEFHEKPLPRRMGYGRDLWAQKKNGVEFPVEISLSYSKSGGRPIAIAFISDISQRKRSEMALRQSEEQLILYATELEKRVMARTEALDSVISKLEKEVTERKRAEEEVTKALEKERELNDLKSKFVSIASHEFRTPLSTILSSIALVDQYRGRKEFEKMDKHIQRVRNSVFQLTGILNDFLSLSRLEEGKVELNPQVFEMSLLLSDVTEDMKALLRPGQHIEMECPQEGMEIEVDSRILRNILFNLLSNASKYSGEGKGIWLTCISNGKGFEISVRDEGIGIPEDDQKHLFERFFRATNTNTIQGTGLGLSIVRRYVELLGGNIKFESTYGKGSIFVVLIPSQYHEENSAD